MDYYVFENFIPSETAREYAKQIYNQSQDDIGNPRPHFKFLPLSHHPIWHDNKYLKEAVRFAEQFIKETFKIEETFEFKRYFAHAMDTGAMIEAHVDDGDIYEGKPKNEKHYSAVLVLNDDYEGGDFYFSNLDKTLSLKAGSMVIFRGDELRKHGVTQVTKGYRVSVPIFFREYKKEDLI